MKKKKGKKRELVFINNYSYCDIDIRTIGPVVYKGKTKGKALELLRYDEYLGKIDTNELFGNFIIVINKKRNEKIIVDSGNLIDIFIDLEEKEWSMNLEYLIKLGKKKAINKNALLEQIITGSIAGEDTIFYGIEKVNSTKKWEKNGRKYIIYKIEKTDNVIINKRKRCIKDIANYQLEVNKEYIKKIGLLSNGGYMCLGLSGGYDSRLLLLLAINAGINIRTYTFSSKAHEKDMALAKVVAKVLGVELREIPVKVISQMDEDELERNIEDVLKYYDGRTNATMGTFNDVHTSKIYKECVKGSSLNLNGLGGELYRNREKLPNYTFHFIDWFNMYVVGPQYKDLFISKKHRHEFEDYLAEKYGKILGVKKLGKMDRYLARKWYRDVWLPYYAGPRLSAENRVFPSLMPFADPQISAFALEATPYIGVHDELEKEMIRQLDERMARIEFKGGQKPGETTIKYRLKTYSYSSVPLKIRLARHRTKLLLYKKYDIKKDRWLLERFKKPIEYMKSFNLPIKIEHLLNYRDSRDRIFYIAEYLYRLRNYIDTGQS